MKGMGQARLNRRCEDEICKGEICIVEIENHSRIIHYPRLDTVLEVEKAIRDAKEYPSMRQLWLSMKKKIMYQTFRLILDYLEYSGKIMICKDGSVVWIYDPEYVKKAKGKGLVLKWKRKE